MIFFRKPVSTFRDHALVPHHQHRAFGVAHDVAGVGAEKIGPHRRPVRRHDDQVGLDRGGLLEDLVIDATLPHRGGDALRLVPFQVCDSVAAVAIAGFARSVSARSSGTRMELNIWASVLAISL